MLIKDKSSEVIKEMFEKYGINDVYIGHMRYAPDGTIEHECAVHVEYLDGRTICITDKGMVRPLGSVRLEFETAAGEQASFSRPSRRPFLISNTSSGE